MIKKYSLKKAILLVFAFILTGIMRFLLLAVPFRYIAAFMGKEKSESPESVDNVKFSKARIIGRTVIAVSGHTPWKSECLVQALTAQAILRIFKIPNTLYLGMAKDDSNKLSAHAWLRCGHAVITGGLISEEFKVVAQYSNNFDQE